MTESKNYKTQQKSLKARQPKNLNHILILSTFEEHTTHGVTKCNNKRCKVCNIIIKENPKPLKTQKRHS